MIGLMKIKNIFDNKQYTVEEFAEYLKTLDYAKCKWIWNTLSLFERQMVKIYL